MNTMLSTTSRHEHPPEREYIRQAQPVRRVRLLDRIALHVGIALIKWGRRPRPIESRERRALRIEHYVARQAREQEMQKLHLLTFPLR